MNEVERTYCFLDSDGEEHCTISFDIKYITRQIGLKVGYNILWGRNIVFQMGFGYSKSFIDHDIKMEVCGYGEGESFENDGTCKQKGEQIDRSYKNEIEKNTYHLFFSTNLLNGAGSSDRVAMFKAGFYKTDPIKVKFENHGDVDLVISENFSILMDITYLWW